MNTDKQYDAGDTAEQYAAASVENADKDTGRNFLRENISGLPRTSVLLDVGCGNGIDLDAYKKMGFSNLFGIDPSAKFIKEASVLLNGAAELQEGTFESIPYGDGMFDIVISRFAMHYAADLEKSTTEVSRVLKPGGKFIAIVSHPAADSLEKRDKNGNITITLFKGSVSITFPQHALDEYFSSTFYKEFTLEKQFEYCGIEQDRGTNGNPNALGFIVRKN
jgi:ubiquinone/menaquinone biosynthesis C-methylase UbiE